jgi:tetratricopeptide (TPR) repeat protein
MKTISFLSVTIFTGIISFSALAQDATSLYQDGVKLKKDKKTREAMEKFRAALALKRDYTEAQYELGWCLNDVSDYSGAIANLRTVRKSWSNYPKVHFELGYAFEKTGQYDSAIQSFNECLKLKPDYAGVYRELGYVAYNQGDYTTALQHFDRHESTTTEEIKDYLYWYRKGFMYNATKDYSSAITALQRSLLYKTDYTNTYLELGFANNKLKKGDEAIDYFKKAIQLDSTSHIPYNGIGEVYRDTKRDMNEAMNWYRKALAINSKERKACFGMGYCLNSQGKYSEALGYLRTAIDQEPTYTAAYVELGYTQYMLGSNSEALTNLNKAMNLNPANENARYYACLVYIKQQDKRMAQKMVDELRNLNSKHVATLQPKVDAL